MILHTGNRTDIPAFYSMWFSERLRAGYALVRNPYDPRRVTRYDINPEVVDLIVFCTKNPGPMLSHMNLLHQYNQYWFVTVTPYGREIEPGIGDKAQVMDDFKRLSESTGKNHMAWRYDPIFIDDTYTADRHVEAFERMARELSGYTGTCVISFIDLYQKVKRNFPQAREVSSHHRLYLGKAFVDIGKKYGITVKTCAEGNDLAELGADCSGCMSLKTFEDAIGSHLNIPSGYKTARSECACFLSSDIGQYDTCGHLCRYCYANSDESAVRRNMKLHDPYSPLLIGNVLPDDVIHQAKQKSWVDMQLRFTD